MSISKSNSYAVASLIKDKYLESITCSDLSKPYIGVKPEDRALVGMLKAGAVTFADNGESFINPENKYKSIQSINMTFLMDLTVSSKVLFEFQGHVYRQELLNYEQEKKSYIDAFNRLHKTELSSVDEVEKKGSNEFVKMDSLYFPTFVYQPVPLNALLNPFEIDFSADVDEQTINDSINEKIAQSIDEKHLVNVVIEPRYRSTDPKYLKTESTYKSFLQKNLLEATPKWILKLRIQTKKVQGNFLRVKICLFNSADLKPSQEAHFDATIYNAGFCITTATAAIRDIELNDFVHDYDDNISVKAIVDNASLLVTERENQIVLQTNNVPVYEENRTVTIDKYNEYITFTRLIHNPIENLQYIHGEMKKDLNAKREDYNREKAQGGHSDKYYRRYLNDLDSYQFEINRFQNGINLIKSRNDVRKAFDLMNRSFELSLIPNRTSYSGWRLFQICFIVSELSDICHSQYKDDPTYKEDSIGITDLIYFPTGGGKTEAFLGCTVFAMFFDRIRGKMEGITTMIRYPLRLLSVQQLDRILDLIERCNSVANTYLGLNDTFSIGYYVGSNNTPNIIKEDHEVFTLDDASLNEKYCVIDTCPRCGKKAVKVSFNRKSWKLEHICSRCQHNLNIRIVDDEIYRYLPTIIVGTIDKLASIGINSDYKMLFGEVNGFCETHGFFSKNQCPYCRSKGSRNLYDPAPTLIIQDELHLVRESLGTYTAHYEGFLRYYCENLLSESNKKRIKYIGATATITNYKEHIHHLYNQNGRCFPTSVKGKNFYSTVDTGDVSRYISGFVVHGRSITDGVRLANIHLRELLFHIATNDAIYLPILTNKYGYIPHEKTLKEWIDDYFISIIYNNSKKDSLSLGATFENQGNNYLRERGIPQYNIAKITADEDFSVIRSVLFDIHDESNRYESTNLILATSSISHGVDESTFNEMFFFGMPNNIAEYIQAYSRVGRKYTGLVFDIIRLVRERDVSYLKNFAVFHKYRDKVIEPVPINRWAINAIYRTLPGVFMGVLLQCYEDKYRYANHFIEAVRTNKIKQSDIEKHILESYGCGKYMQGNRQYAEIIRSEVNSVFTGVSMMSVDSNEFTSRIVAKSLKYGFQPMLSLRDVDVSLQVDLR